MTKKSLLILVLLAAGFITRPERAFAQKELFIEKKCDKCHAVSAAGIEKKGGDDEEEEGAPPPDLSHVGKDHDAKYMKDFLLKNVDHTPHGDLKSTKKHPVKFKGSDEELDKMAQWLASLK